ncbi:MAG: ankyrin repeat domain-containing protein [Candidatus Babeliales bacterium]
MARDINAKVVYQGHEVTGVEGIKTLLGKPNVSDAESARRIGLYDPNEKNKDGSPLQVTAYMSAARNLNQAALALFLPYLNQEAKDLAFKNLGIYSKSESVVKNIYIMLMMAGANWGAYLADANASSEHKAIIKKALKDFLAYFGVRSINPDEFCDASGKEVEAKTAPLKAAFSKLNTDFSFWLGEQQQIAWRFDRVPYGSDLYESIKKLLQKYPGYDDAKKAADKKVQQDLQNELIMRASGGFLDGVKGLILSQHVPVDATGVNQARSEWGSETALYDAAYTGNLDMVNFLLDAGADVNKVVNLAYAVFDSPLRAAVKGGHADVVGRLLAAPGIKIDNKEEIGGPTTLELARTKQKAYGQIVTDLQQSPVLAPRPAEKQKTGPHAPTRKAPKRSPRK